MTLFFETSSFFESSGNTAAAFGEQLRDQIVTHACNIWGAYPKFVTNGRNPASSFARGYMNSTCAMIQPPPTINPPPFTGGQCVDETYTVFTFQNVSATDQLREHTLDGPIVGIFYLFGGTASGGPTGTLNLWTGQLQGKTVSTRSVTPSFFIPDNLEPPGNFEVNIASIDRQDGQPDNCGDPPPSYPDENPPTQGDLNTTITINNNDTVNTDYTLEWNQIDNNYNFPMAFKLNGTNVTLSVGGLTVQGNKFVVNTGSDNSSPPPGSDGGQDVDGNDYVNVFVDGDYPEWPEFTQPDLVDTSIEYLLCDTDALETINKTVKLIPGVSPVLTSLLEVLTNIVEELCVEDSDVGVPEIYPVLPGAERPSLVLYYKEVIDGRKQSSTYVSTVPNPSSTTVAQIETLSPPDRALGKYVSSLLLKDGSRLIARGVDEAEANSYLNYLIGLVSSNLLPANISNSKVLTKQQKLQEVDVKCTQVEYYPDGKNFGVSPSVRRTIPV